MQPVQRATMAIDATVSAHAAFRLSSTTATAQATVSAGSLPDLQLLPMEYTCSTCCQHCMGHTCVLQDGSASARSCQSPCCLSASSIDVMPSLTRCLRRRRRQCHDRLLHATMQTMDHDPCFVIVSCSPLSRISVRRQRRARLPPCHRRQRMLCRKLDGGRPPPPGARRGGAHAPGGCAHRRPRGGA